MIFLTVKLGQESCSKADRCPEGMSCLSGVCACVMGTMTNDRKFCLKNDEKLLGEYCTPSIDKCYQLSGIPSHSMFPYFSFFFVLPKSIGNISSENAVYNFK